MAQTDGMRSLPLYSRAWNVLKRFPQGLYAGTKQPYTRSGPAAAALISAGIGPVTMMIVHHLSDTSKERENFIKLLGSWIPGSVNPDPLWGNIGSYAGKETVMLIGWLLSWLVLHLLLRNRQVKPSVLFFWMLSLLTLATAMSWHPLFPYLPLQ